MWRRILASWNPNKYHGLREMSLLKVLKLAAYTSAFSVLVFLLLILPNLFHADEVASQLAKTTNITISASMQQSIGTYIVKNPDVLVTASSGDGFIVITPSGVTVKQFVFFGSRTYSWSALSSLQLFPATKVVVTLFLMLLPSMLFWGSLLLLLSFVVLCLLYTMITYFVQHARNFHVMYADLWKVSVYASIPAMMLFAATPILRLGLPLAIVFGFVFVFWLVLSLLGTTLFSEKHVAGHKKSDGEQA